MMPTRAPHTNIEVDRPFASKVEAMAGFGLPAADIALVLAMDLDELQSIYQRELETGTIKTNLRVAERLYQQALGDGRQAVTAAIFWFNTYAGWRPPGPALAPRCAPVPPLTSGIRVRPPRTFRGERCRCWSEPRDTNCFRRAEHDARETILPEYALRMSKMSRSMLDCFMLSHVASELCLSRELVDEVDDDLDALRTAAARNLEGGMLGRGKRGGRDRSQPS